MYSVVTNGGMKDGLNSSLVGRKLRPAKLAVAIVRGAMTLAVLSALLIAARPAQAQTEQVLWNFTGTPDGMSPTSRLTFNGPNLFGTTYSGGAYGNGSVFELTPNGSGGWNESVLYSFCPASPSCTDGANPTYSYVIFDGSGNMYGTVFNGGANGQGGVFELKPSGSTWTESIIYSFANTPDGANPINGLITDKSGNMYGTTYAGGTAGGNGTVFELTPSGSGTWTEQPIYDINSNGSGLSINSAGDIIGTTFTSVFALVPASGGGLNPVVIFTFTSANAAKGGADPIGTPVFDSANNIYGTTASGGTNNDGVIYKLTRGTTGGFKETVLANFGSKLGLDAMGALVFDSAGNIYGAAQQGGQKGAGTVYELAAPASGSTNYTASVVWNFNGENGAGPDDSPILDSSGYLYLTTSTGGSSGDGAVVEVNAHAATTTTTVVSSANPSTEGQAVTFTATVTSSTGATPPNGDIVVFEPIGQSAITNGVATYTTSALAVGTTKITAVYQGDLNFITSKSASIEQVVNK